MQILSQEQRSYTYHSFLPDDAHTILNPRKPVGDLCKIILAHGPLFDGEWTVVRPQNIQSVTAAQQSEMEGHIYCCSSGRFYSVRFYRVNPHFPSRLMRKLGVLGSRRRGGTVTWAAAWAQSW